ncbi:TPA: polymer-forming cytoskeletal protein [Morganella morganii]|uniref:bactofilin family protein n=1 Tax=Morganella morganii TaxID=582 RepID=UPI003EB98898|nr:polymer-forming cytoskeletal protein [Morganella morganii]
MITILFLPDWNISSDSVGGCQRDNKKRFSAGCSAGGKTTLFINGCLGFWFAALVLWVQDIVRVGRICFLLSGVFFGLHLCQTGVVSMFGNKNRKTVNAGTDAPAPENETPDVMTEPGGTVIACGGVFEGNIRAGEAVCVCGTLRGDISAPDCAVRIMDGGTVAGNITARTLMVDGLADGECDAGDVIIGGSGRFCGTLRYTQMPLKSYKICSF